MLCRITVFTFPDAMQDEYQIWQKGNNDASFGKRVPGCLAAKYISFSRAIANIYIFKIHV
jgi:hypothetical protein